MKLSPELNPSRPPTYFVRYFTVSTTVAFGYFFATEGRTNRPVLALRTRVALPLEPLPFAIPTTSFEPKSARERKPSRHVAYVSATLTDRNVCVIVKLDFKSRHDFKAFSYLDAVCTYRWEKSLDKPRQVNYYVCMHTIEDIIASIDQMDGDDLDCVQAALDRKRHRVSASSVVERRDYGSGILQLEYRTNPKTGKQRGPYWYYHYREDGKQRTLYVGVTDEPESKLVEKLRCQ